MYLRKIVLAAISILLCIVVVGSTTLAFTINRESVVSNLDFTAASSTGMTIAITSPGVASIENLKRKDFTDINGEKVYFSGFDRSITFLDVEKAVGETTPGSNDIPGYGNSRLDYIQLAALAGGVFVDYRTQSESFNPHFLIDCFSKVSTEIKPIQNEHYMAFKLWFKIETDIGGHNDHYIVPKYEIGAIDPNAFILNNNAGDDAKWQKGTPVTVSAANALRLTTVTEDSATERKEVFSFAPQDHYMENNHYIYPDLGGFASRSKQSRSLLYYHNSVATTSYYNQIWGGKGIDLPHSDGKIYDYKSQDYVYSEEHYGMYLLQSKTRVQSELEADPEVGYFGPAPFKITIQGIDDVVVDSVIGVDFYVYLDGWDADCFDAILTQKMRIDLFFQLSALNPLDKD